MNIHIPTIILVIAISVILSIVMLLAQYFLNKKDKAIIYWMLSFCIFAMAETISYLLNLNIIGSKALVIIEDILLIVGFITLAIGLKIFFFKPIPKRLFIFLFSAILISTGAYYFHTNFNIEQGVLIFIIGIICYIICVDLINDYNKSKSIISISMGVLFGIYALLFFTQAILDIYWYTAIQSKTQLITPVIYLLSYVMSTLTTFGFVLLLNQRLVVEREQALKAMHLSENKYKNDFHFLQSILESPQDIIIYALDTNYCYTAYTNFYKLTMKKILGIDIFNGKNMLDIITNNNEVQTIKEHIDRSLNGEHFVIDEDYEDENQRRSFFRNRYSPIKDAADNVIGVSVFVIDITEKKKADILLQETKNHFETLFKVSPDATIISLLPGGEIVDINDTFETIAGYDRATLIGKKVLEMGFWDNTNDRANFLAAIVATGTCKNQEVTFVKKDGTKLPFLINAKAYFVNEKPHLLSILHDISDRKKAEEKLYLNQYAMTHTSDAVIWVREDGSFFDMNTAACELFGYSKAELLTMKVLDIDPEFNENKWPDHWIELKEKKRLNFITKQLRKDGFIIELEVNANYIFTNGIELVCSFIRDITERRKNETEKEKVRLNNEALINNTTDLMWSVNRNYELITGNSSFTNTIYDYTGKLMEPGNTVLISDKFDEKYIVFWKDLYDKVVSGKSQKVEFNVPNSDNISMRWSEVILNPIYNDESITGIACFGRNITERKQQDAIVKDLNIQLNQRAIELAVSNKELEQFAYIASHDLQEPLRMVSSFLQLLEKKYKNQLDEKGIQYINFAVDGALRMRQIILDLLEYSRVGKNVQQNELIDMNQLVNDVRCINSIAIKEGNATST